MDDIAVVGSRAGFWRRVTSLLIDSLVILIPLQIVVAILFQLTSGQVQGAFGLTFSSCRPVSQWKTALIPAPPEGANYAGVCETSLFGLTTARALIVGRRDEKVGTNGVRTVVKEYQHYMLDKADNVIDGVDFSLIGNLVFLVGILLQQACFGKTLGDDGRAIRIVRRADPRPVGIGIGRALARMVLLTLSFTIFIAPGLVIFFSSTGSAAELMQVLSGPPAIIMFGGAALQVVFDIWMLADIARKRDPIFDRLAGTAVVRTDLPPYGSSSVSQ